MVARLLLATALTVAACDRGDWPSPAVPPTAPSSVPAVRDLLVVHGSWSAPAARPLDTCPAAFVSPHAPRPNYSPLRSGDGRLGDVGIYSYETGGIFAAQPEFPHDADGGYTLGPRDGPILAFSVATPAGELRCAAELDFARGPLTGQIVITVHWQREEVATSTLSVPVRLTGSARSGQRVGGTQ